MLLGTCRWQPCVPLDCEQLLGPMPCATRLRCLRRNGRCNSSPRLCKVSTFLVRRRTGSSQESEQLRALQPIVGSHGCYRPLTGLAMSRTPHGVAGIGFPVSSKGNASDGGFVPQLEEARADRPYPRLVGVGLSEIYLGEGSDGDCVSFRGDPAARVRAHATIHAIQFAQKMRDGVVRCGSHRLACLLSCGTKMSACRIERLAFGKRTPGRYPGVERRRAPR